MYEAVSGGGAYCNGIRMHVDSASELPRLSLQPILDTVETQMFSIGNPMHAQAGAWQHTRRPHGGILLCVDGTSSSGRFVCILRGTSWRALGRRRRKHYR